VSVPAHERAAVIVGAGVGWIAQIICSDDLASGRHPGDGQQIPRVEGKTDYARGITCNVGLVKGGTGVNVVSARRQLHRGARHPDVPRNGEALGRSLATVHREPARLPGAEVSGDAQD